MGSALALTMITIISLSCLVVLEKCSGEVIVGYVESGKDISFLYLIVHRAKEVSHYLS